MTKVTYDDLLRRNISHTHTVEYGALYLKKAGDTATGTIVFPLTFAQAEVFIATINTGTTRFDEDLVLPAQATHNGQFLTTNGSVSSWGTITSSETDPIFNAWLYVSPPIYAEIDPLSWSKAVSQTLLTGDKDGSFDLTTTGIVMGMKDLKEKTTTYTLTADDEVILCNGTFTVTLPTAVGITGKKYTIKNVGTGVVTIDATHHITVIASPATVSESTSFGNTSWVNKDNVKVEDGVFATLDNHSVNHVRDVHMWLRTILGVWANDNPYLPPLDEDWDATLKYVEYDWGLYNPTHANFAMGFSVGGGVLNSYILVCEGFGFTTPIGAANISYKAYVKRKDALGAGGGGASVGYVDHIYGKMEYDLGALETIDGEGTQVMNIQYTSMSLVSNGTSWHII